MADQELHDTDTSEVDKHDDSAHDTNDVSSHEENKASVHDEHGVSADEEHDDSTDDELVDSDQSDDDEYDVSLDKVQAVLNASVDESQLTPQMRRMVHRQEENTRRVEETIKGTKANPPWLVPTFCTLMIIGLAWAVTYYITTQYPIPGIGNWNLLIAMVIILTGFLMTMWWR